MSGPENDRSNEHRQHCAIGECDEHGLAATETFVGLHVAELVLGEHALWGMMGGHESSPRAAVAI